MCGCCATSAVPARSPALISSRATLAPRTFGRTFARSHLSHRRTDRFWYLVDRIELTAAGFRPQPYDDGDRESGGCNDERHGRAERHPALLEHADEGRGDGSDRGAGVVREARSHAADDRGETLGQVRRRHAPDADPA